jgi:hypothetical protein
MKHLGKATSVAASLALMVAAPAAVASGGKAFGGVATGGGGTTTTTTTTTTASGGGGGGGGTAGGGGGGGTQTQNRGATDPAQTTTVAPAPAPAPSGPACATFTSTSAPVGYYLTFAALWHDYQVKSCNTLSENVSVRATDVNRATGAADYTVTVPYGLASGGSVTGVLDNDFAPFSTTYDVKMEIVDQAGNVLDSSLITATTPDPR